jgi:hypothetical protein
MKFFPNTSFKSLAAAAAVMFFSSSAVYAACTMDCGTYASNQANLAGQSVYNQVFYSCINHASYGYCTDYAQRESQKAYNTAYTHYYGECMSGRCV